MINLNPAKLLREKKEKDKQRTDALVLFTERVKELVHNPKLFTALLKEAGVTAKDYAGLAQKVSTEMQATKGWVHKTTKVYDFKTYADIAERGSVLFRVAVAVRAECAEDIASDISSVDALYVILDNLITSS